MALAETLKVSDNLAGRAACVADAEPCRDVRGVIVERFHLLQVYDHDRNVQVTDGRKIVVRSRVGEHLQEDDIDVRRAEEVAGFLSLLLGRHHPAVDDLDRVREALLELFVLALELRHELRELGQIGAQRDGKYTNLRFCIDQHGFTSLISKLPLMAFLVLCKSSNSPAAMNCTTRFPIAVPSTGPA